MSRSRPRPQKLPVLRKPKLPKRHVRRAGVHRDRGEHVNVIVGLGNPGQRYRQTRHNLGFDVVDALAERYHIAVRQREAEALCGTGQIGGHAGAVRQAPDIYEC